MALKLVVDNLDGIEESLRPLYVEKDGKFNLAVDGIEDTSGLKSALAAERKRASDLEKKVKGWEKSGKTPDEISELIEAQQQRETSEAERKGEWEKLKAQMNTAHQAELAKASDAMAALRKRLNAELVDKTAVSEIAAASGVPDLLLPHVQRFTKVGDDLNVIVVDAKGDPRVKGNGDPFTIKDLVSEMKASEVFGRAFNGSGQSGSGTQPANGSGGSPQYKRRSDFKTRKERTDFVDKYGKDAYFALPA